MTGIRTLFLGSCILLAGYPNLLGSIAIVIFGVLVVRERPS